MGAAVKVTALLGLIRLIRPIGPIRPIVLIGLFGLMALGGEPPKAGGKVPKGDDEQQLRADREKRRGPTFPGKDPAFLVLPRPAERSRMAEQLLTAAGRTRTTPPTRA